MSDAAIEFEGLSKRFGKVEAVRDLSFSVQKGRVTGFLGPNGAGKSTTLRMLLGLVRPNAGSASFAGVSYEKLPHPSAQVGAVLEEASFHPGSQRAQPPARARRRRRPPRTRAWTRCSSRSALPHAADRRVKGYSMGMRQRLAIAAALLGDPEVLILDEPTNGLDPPGIRWMRDLLRDEAARGSAVLVSSHLLAEVAQSVDDVVVISHGVLRGQRHAREVLGGGRRARHARAGRRRRAAGGGAARGRPHRERRATPARCWCPARSPRPSARSPPTRAWRWPSWSPSRARSRTSSSS